MNRKTNVVTHGSCVRDDAGIRKERRDLKDLNVLKVLKD